MKRYMEYYEELLLKAYLLLPQSKLLNHRYEVEEDYLAGRINSFMRGERFSETFSAFSKEDSNYINKLITNNITTDEGKDLLTAYLLAKVVCNILNKYRD